MRKNTKQNKSTKNLDRFCENKNEKWRQGNNLFLRSKMPMFQWAGMREGGEPLPLAFQYLILMIRPCDLNLVMISSLASKCQHFKLRGLQFNYMTGKRAFQL